MSEKKDRISEIVNDPRIREFLEKNVFLPLQSANISMSSMTLTSHCRDAEAARGCITVHRKRRAR